MKRDLESRQGGEAAAVMMSQRRPYGEETHRVRGCSSDSSDSRSRLAAGSLGEQRDAGFDVRRSSLVVSASSSVMRESRLRTGLCRSDGLNFRIHKIRVCP